jgi:hypothetical protein
MMKSALRIIGLAIGLALAQVAWAGESSSRLNVAARAAQSESALSFFELALESASKAGPPRYTGTQIKPVQAMLKRDALNAIVESGKLQEAKNRLIQLAPEVLPELARALANSATANEAIEIIKLASDDDEQLKIESEAFEGLLESGKLASAELYLSNRAKDIDAGMLYARLATAQAKASDRAGYQKSLIEAAKAAEDVQQPRRNKILRDLAAAQAAAGDYAESRKTQRNIEGNVFEKMEELVLEAQLRRGEVKPADAYGMIRMNGAAPVLDVILEIQMKSKDFDGITTTIDKMLERRKSFNFSKTPVLIVDCFYSAGKITEAEVFIENFKDTSELTLPASKALMYGRLAKNQFKAGDKTAYSRLMKLAIEKAGEIRDLGEASSFAMPESSGILGELALSQIELHDFSGAEKTIDLIKDALTQQKCKVQCKASELAANGKIEEAKSYAQNLDDAEDRTLAFLSVALELLTKK